MASVPSSQVYRALTCHLLAAAGELGDSFFILLLTVLQISAFFSLFAGGIFYKETN